MAVKLRITRQKLCSKDKTLGSFLDRVESGTPLTEGMWKKLYAVIAVLRNCDKKNYWIYDSGTNEYDVTNQTITPITIEDGATIGELIAGKVVHK